MADQENQETMDFLISLVDRQLFLIFHCFLSFLDFLHLWRLASIRPESMLAGWAGCPTLVGRWTIKKTKKYKEKQFNIKNNPWPIKKFTKQWIYGFPWSVMGYSWYFIVFLGFLDFLDFSSPRQHPTTTLAREHARWRSLRAMPRTSCSWSVNRVKQNGPRRLSNQVSWTRVAISNGHMIFSMATGCAIVFQNVDVYVFQSLSTTVRAHWGDDVNMNCVKLCLLIYPKFTLFGRGHLCARLRSVFVQYLRFVRASRNDEGEPHPGGSI